MNNSLKTKRPLSPHLQIYKVQITSLLSILHRGTGIILYGGAVFCALWFLALAEGPQTYDIIRGFVVHPVGIIMLMGLSFAFFYHLCNGMRHLLWDAGMGYEMVDVRKTGWLVVIFSVFLTSFAWALGLIYGEILS